VAWSER
jgi:hypothetical protein